MGLSTPDLPLYGSERIPSFAVGQTVVVCEGEKATEALWSAGIDALGTVTGTSAPRRGRAVGAPAVRRGALARSRPRRLRPHEPGAGARGWSPGGVAAALRGACGGADGTALHIIAAKGFDAADASTGAVRAGRRRRAVGSPRGGAEGPPSVPSTIAMPTTTASMRPLASAAASSRGASARRRRADRARRGGAARSTATAPRRFKVDLREPFFRCFGCDARGDVFTFLRGWRASGSRTRCRAGAAEAARGGDPVVARTEHDDDDAPQPASRRRGRAPAVRARLALEVARRQDLGADDVPGPPQGHVRPVNAEVTVDAGIPSLGVKGTLTVERLSLGDGNGPRGKLANRLSKRTGEGDDAPVDWRSMIDGICSRILVSQQAGPPIDDVGHGRREGGQLADRGAGRGAPDHQHLRRRRGRQVVAVAGRDGVAHLRRRDHPRLAPGPARARACTWTGRPTRRRSTAASG
jgi:hypothetical protein